MDVLARLCLGRSPIGTAQLVELRSLGAYVLADLVELVGGNEQLVGRRPTLAGRVFDDQILTRGTAVADACGALPHFDEPPDAMLLMHDVIAGLQFHQVDGLATTLRRFRLAYGGCAAGQVAFGEQCDFRGVVDESVDGAGADAIEIGDACLVDGAFQTIQRPLRARGHGHRIAGVEQSLDAGGGLLLIAAVFSGIGGIDADVPGLTVVHTETGEFPHIMPRKRQGGNRFLKIVEIRLVKRDGCPGTMSGRGHMPARREEFIGGFGEVVGRATQFLRIGQHDQRVFRQHAAHRLHVVDQGGQQRFHTFHGNGVGD